MSTRAKHYYPLQVEMRSEISGGVPDGFPDIGYFLANKEAEEGIEFPIEQARLLARNRVNKWATDNRREPVFDLSGEKFWMIVLSKSSPSEVGAILRQLSSYPRLVIEEALQYVKKVKNFPLATLRDMIRDYQKEKKPEEPAKKATPTTTIPSLTPDETKQADLELLQKQPLVWLRNTLDLVIVGNVHQKLTIALLFCAGNPLGFIIQAAVLGPSGIGKTWLVQGTLQLAPDADRDTITASTGAALRDLLEECKDNRKILFLQEKEGVSEDDSMANLIIRVLSADDKGGKVLLMDPKSGGGWGLREVHLAENISFITTYAGGMVAHQNETRMWLISSDQTRRYMGEVIRGGVFQDTFDREDAMHKYLLRARVWQEVITPQMVDVRNDGVIIPFLSILSTMFEESPTAEPTIRDAKKFRILIEIITKLHAAVLPGVRASIMKDGRRYWIVEYADFALACEIAGPLIQINRLRLTETQIKLYRALQALEEDQVMENDKGFSIKDIAIRADVPTEYARRLLKNLQIKGYIEAKKVTKDGKVQGYETSLDQDLELSPNWGLFFKNSITFEVQHYFEKAGIRKSVAEPYIALDGVIEDQTELPPRKERSQPLVKNVRDGVFAFDAKDAKPQESESHFQHLKDMLKAMESENNNEPVEVQALQGRMVLDGINEEEVDSLLKRLKKEEHIYYPKKGFLKSTY